MTLVLQPPLASVTSALGPRSWHERLRVCLVVEIRVRQATAIRASGAAGV
jgi:hypothetical protein